MWRHKGKPKTLNSQLAKVVLPVLFCPLDSLFNEKKERGELNKQNSGR